MKIEQKEQNNAMIETEVQKRIIQNDDGESSDAIRRKEIIGKTEKIL